MNLQYFPNFVRLNLKEVESSNEELNEVGVEFKKYLEKIFEGKMEKLEEIWNIDPMNVIPKIGHPFYTNGYNSVLVYHFTDFLKKMFEETQK